MGDRIDVPLELNDFEVLTSNVVDDVMEVEVRSTLPAACFHCGSTDVVGHGKRLRPESLAVKLASWSIADFTAFSLAAARPAVDKILAQLTPRQREVAGRPLEEVAERLDFLLAVGLGYLSLSRSAAE